MAEIIKGKFGEDRNKKPEKKEPAKLEPISGSPPVGPIESWLQGLESSGIEVTPNIRAIQKAFEIARYIGSLQGPPPSREVLAEAERHWKQLSLEELLDAATNSNKLEWGKYPGRYQALAQELRKRFKG